MMHRLLIAVIKKTFSRVRSFTKWVAMFFSSLAGSKQIKRGIHLGRRGFIL